MVCYKITGGAVVPLVVAALVLSLQLGSSTASQESGMACDSNMCDSFGAIANDIPTPEVDAATVPAQLKHLGTFSDNPDGPETGCTRLIFTEKDVQARDYVKGLMRDAGLEIREDAMGNIFGRWVGSRPDLPAVGTGSHADAIPKSGAYTRNPN